MKYCYIFSVLLDAVAETLLFAHVNQPRFTSTSSVLYVYYASCDWLNLIRILIDYCFWFAGGQPQRWHLHEQQFAFCRASCANFLFLVHFAFISVLLLTRRSWKKYRDFYGGVEGGGGRGKRFVFWILTSLNPKILIFLVLCYNNEEQMYSNIKLGSLVLS